MIERTENKKAVAASENETTKPSGVLDAHCTPTSNDVLCGKDKNCHTHPGNKAFRQLVASMVEPYLKAKSKQDKMFITRTVVETMKEKFQTRFLRKPTNASDHWQEISDGLARDKVSHAIRFAAAQAKLRKEPKAAAAKKAIASTAAKVPKPSATRTTPSTAASTDKTAESNERTGEEKSSISRRQWTVEEYEQAVLMTMFQQQQRVVGDGATPPQPNVENSAAV